MQLSPLRYPGGKSRAAKILEPFIPDDVERVISPFFGGGSFENYLAKKNIPVYGYDFCLPLVDFWQAYLNRKDELFDRAEKMASQILDPRFWDVDRKSPEREAQKDLYFSWKEIALNSKDPFERGLHYFSLNRCAFSGLTLIAGPMSTKWINTKIGPKALANLRKIDFKVRSVEYRSCFDSIVENNGEFLYLDPPYVMETESKENIYGHDGDMHAGFDHVLLRDTLADHSGRWVMSYLDVPKIRELYKDFNIQNVTWTYTMKPGQDRPKGAEVVITNF
jgi:DNA adenine methylase